MTDGSAVGTDAEALFLAAAAYGQVDDAGGGLGRANGYGEVLAPERWGVQQAPEPVVHVAGLGGAHDARGAAVEPVHGVKGRGGA